MRVDAALVFDHFTNRWWELGELDLASRLGPPRDLRTDAGEPISSTGRDRYEASVRRALDYIRAGDVYQVNIAHEMHARFDGDPLDWFIARGREARPRYGAFVSLPSLRLAAASLSPELFLEHDPITRRLATRLAKEQHSRHARTAPLDFRRTVRASIATGGVPITTHHRPKRPHRTDLVVLCDVSGSVANFAQFTLLFVFALREVFQLSPEIGRAHV